MTVSMDQIQKGVSTYYENEFCQKSNGIDKFAAYFMLPSIPLIVKNKLDAIKTSPFVEGLIDKDGLVEIDAVRDRAYNAMQHCGSIEYMGFRIGSEDVDKLYECIRRA